MRDSTPYSIVATTDGELAVIIEQGPFVAIGETDLRALLHTCGVAVRAIEQREQEHRERAGGVGIE